RLLLAVLRRVDGGWARPLRRRPAAAVDTGGAALRELPTPARGLHPLCERAAARLLHRRPRFPWAAHTGGLRPGPDTAAPDRRGAAQHPAGAIQGRTG